MTGVSINSADDFKELFEKDPSLAMAVLYENVVDINCKCSNRMTECEQKRKESRIKNVAVQFGGGVSGGVLTAWLLIKAYASQMLTK